MADDSLNSLHLALMQDVLPLGLAMVERGKKGGVEKIMEAFTSNSAPFEELRLEGEPAAQNVRDRLDEIKPGLGNPVTPVTVEVKEEPSTVDTSLDQVTVEVKEEPPTVDTSQDQVTLKHVLGRIQVHLEAIDELFDTSGDCSTSSKEKG